MTVSQQLVLYIITISTCSIEGARYIKGHGHLGRQRNRTRAVEVQEAFPETQEVVAVLVEYSHPPSSTLVGH